MYIQHILFILCLPQYELQEMIAHNPLLSRYSGIVEAQLKMLKNLPFENQPDVDSLLR